MTSQVDSQAVAVTSPAKSMATVAWRGAGVAPSRPTYRQSHGTLGVLNEWPSCLSMAGIGLATATDTLEFTYAIQWIRRRVLTYT